MYVTICHLLNEQLFGVMSTEVGQRRLVRLSWHDNDGHSMTHAHADTCASQVHINLYKQLDYVINLHNT